MPDRSPASTPPHAPKFDVIADGGFDAFETLLNDVPFAPFTLNFGSDSFSADELPRQAFFEKLRSGEPHPTTSQPAPEEYAVLYRAAGRHALIVTISEGLSGSLNAAEQATGLASDARVTLHDSGTLSAAQAFQVHAAMTARAMGHDVETAVEWMRTVHAETELYFTIDTLEFLRRGGRLGAVQATLGTMLSLRPVITVDKAAGTYTNVGRARSWLKAMDAVAKQVAARFGAGTPLRAAIVYGADRDDAKQLQERLGADHELLWTDVAPVGVALAVHTGPKAVGLAVAPGPWPWER